MSVSILCVGKLREKYWAEAAGEYVKRLSRLMPVTITEIPDEPEPSQPSEALCRQVMRKEGEKLLRMIEPQDYVIALCIKGQSLSSETLAEKLSTLFTQGKSHIVFIIGGSLGLDEAVVQRANERMSMSSMTFPHQLARVMLLEQLFRSAKINAGERYHK